MDVLTSYSKCFATGRKDMGLGRLTDHAFSHSSRYIDHVLAVVENKKDFLLTKKGKKTAKRIVRLRHESERRRHGCRDELGIGQHTEINKKYLTFKAGDQFVRDGDGNRGFTDSTWTDDADEAMQHKLGRQGLNDLFAADHPR